MDFQPAQSAQPERTGRSNRKRPAAAMAPTRDAACDTMQLILQTNWTPTAMIPVTVKQSFTIEAVKDELYVVTSYHWDHTHLYLGNTLLDTRRKLLDYNITADTVLMVAYTIKPVIRTLWKPQMAFILEVEMRDTMLTVLTKIRQKFNFDTTRMYLAWRGDQLFENHRVADYDIQHGMDGLLLCERPALAAPASVHRSTSPGR